jgi:hypothetical protein
MNTFKYIYIARKGIPDIDVRFHAKPVGAFDRNRNFRAIGGDGIDLSILALVIG